MAKDKLHSKTTNIGFWVIILVVSLLPLGFARLGIDLYLMPQIEISTTFFLSIYARTKSWQFFIYGLFIDVAYGNPIGICPLTLLLLNHIICKFKANLAKQNMGVILLYFIYSMLAITVLKYVIFSIYYASEIMLYIREILINLLINILSYPIIHSLLSNKIRHENQQ